MPDINSFGFIGGDKRQLYCAASAADDGYGVYLYGFDQCGSSAGTECASLSEMAKKCDAIILPLPVTKDGITVNAPLSDEKIELNESFWKLFDSKPVFCGMKNRLHHDGKLLFDYATREEFAVDNAVPTSEGAIAIAMREYDGTVNGSRCLVTGYGRIGRILSKMLCGLGADVTVSARNLRDLAFIRADGMRAVNTCALEEKYDLIFNTVPAMVFDAHTLARTAVNALVIDLASAPGGVDYEAAKRLSIKAVHALSLPGKAAPKSAGIIIKNAVYNMIREEKL